jgi:hypothetical protein
VHRTRWTPQERVRSGLGCGWSFDGGRRLPKAGGSGERRFFQS